MKVALLLLVTLNLGLINIEPAETINNIPPEFMYYYNWGTVRKSGSNFKAVYTKVLSIKKQANPGQNQVEMDKITDTWTDYLNSKYGKSAITNAATEWYPNELEAMNTVAQQRKSFMANNYEMEHLSRWPDVK